MATPVRAENSARLFSTHRRNRTCHLYGGWITTSDAPTDSANWTARTIFPVGSVPHTRLVISRNGA